MKFKADLRPEDALLILAAFLVLFSTAWDPYGSSSCGVHDCLAGLQAGQPDPSSSIPLNSLFQPSCISIR
jgi:hypothetical protein